jgi:membrane protease YdiL (CAAX protease family)
MGNAAKKHYFWRGFALIVIPTVCCLVLSRFGYHSTEGMGQPGGSDLLLRIVLYPVIEEVTFRGILQPWLLTHLHRAFLGGAITLANLLTSFVFAAIHLVHHTPLQAAAVFVPSLVFGWVREHTGSVVPAILMHSYYNLIFWAAMG